MEQIRGFSRYLVNLPGWHTKRKLLVIESDDWGTIRMPSRSVYESLLRNGIRVDKYHFSKYDSLASEKDMSSLIQLLSSFKDNNGKHPVITTNVIVANPDFDKIKASDYMTYFYEPFTETLKKYPEHLMSFELLKRGINEGIFRPQFHGREHLNVIRWLRALRNNTGNVRLAFDYQMFDLSESPEITENSFMEAFNLESLDELAFQIQAIKDGTKIFEEIFGFRSKTFIAPCHIWSSALNQELFENGIEAFQGNWFQFEPIHGRKHKFRKVFHYTGQRNLLGQTYMVRNCSFEPSENGGLDYLDFVLQRIEKIFRYKKPAILGSHRLNYIGYIDPKNTERNLNLLEQLFKKVQSKWPDIEFISSDQLAGIIKSSRE